MKIFVTYEEVRAKHESALREIFGFRAKRALTTGPLEDLLKQQAKNFDGLPRQLRSALKDIAYLLSEPIPGLAGKRFRVERVRSVQTGEYYAPHVSHTYMGECDNEPGGLSNVKVRRLATLSTWSAIMRSQTEFPVEHLKLVDGEADEEGVMRAVQM